MKLLIAEHNVHLLKDLFRYEWDSNYKGSRTIRNIRSLTYSRCTKYIDHKCIDKSTNTLFEIQGFGFNSVDGELYLSVKFSTGNCGYVINIDEVYLID